MSDKEYYPLGDIVADVARKGEETSTTIKIQDAGSETAKILVPQYGSDKDWLDKGKIDFRRFSHLDPVDPYWCSFFRLLPREQGGEWASNFVEEYANFMYAVDGRHKKIGVDIQKAVSGKDSGSKDKKQRSLTDRLLGRNKDDE